MAIDIWWYEARDQWCADVPSEDGRKRLYLGPNEAKARAKLHGYLAEYYEQSGDEPPDSESIPRTSSGNTISLVELAVRFLNWNKTNRSHGTWRNYRDGLKHVTRTYRDKLAVELTPSDIEQVKTKMIEDDYAARTINIMVTAVKRLFNWAVKQGILDENQLDGVEHVSKHVNAPEHPPERHMSLERARRCIELCRDSSPLGDICELLLLTGMRIGELVRITWGDIDFSQRMLTLERHKTSGRANARPRQIPLCDRALEIIRAQAPEEPEPTSPVFVGENDQQFTGSALHCRLRRLRREHPELKGFSFHKLRHTCATHLARLDVPERVAQAILGHSSTLMTRYYTATGRDEMLEAVEKLSERTEADE